MKLGDLAPCPCSAVQRRIDAAMAEHVRTMHGMRRGRRYGLGALAYHSFGDVAAEKIRVNALVSQTMAAWNQCSDAATDATGQQLSTDINAWYTAWRGFTNTGQENYADFPDNDEWDTTVAYEQQLQALTTRINAYCGAGLPAVYAPPASPTSPLALATAVIGAIALAVVVVEVVPILTVVVNELAE